MWRFLFSGLMLALMLLPAVTFAYYRAPQTILAPYWCGGYYASYPCGTGNYYSYHQHGAGHQQYPYTYSYYGNYWNFYGNTQYYPYAHYGYGGGWQYPQSYHYQNYDDSLGWYNYDPYWGY